VTRSSPLEAVARRHAGRAESAVAWLRLAAVGLFAGAERLPPAGDNDRAFFILLGLYLVWSVGVLIVTHTRGATPRQGLVTVVVDIVVITVLSALSGGALSDTRIGYVFVPLTVAFRYQPRLTLIATAVSVLAFVLEPVLDIGPDRPGDTVGYVALWAGLLAWVGVSATVLSAIIARRTDEVMQLVGDREQLLTEVLAAEHRERQALAEGLHDGPVQSLLATRHDLEEVAVKLPEDEALARADETLLDIARQLRSAIFELHPHVLDEAGLEAAVRQIAEAGAQRAGLELTLELDSLPAHKEIDRMLFSVARELITNVVKHAHATHLTVTLHEAAGERILTVSDDGAGFDPAVLSEQLSRGHVGVASQRMRLERLGGRLELSRRPGGGTDAIARIPLGSEVTPRK
jgi:two-component system, NarL family, sensor kinase